VAVPVEIRITVTSLSEIFGEYIDNNIYLYVCISSVNLYSALRFYSLWLQYTLQQTSWPTSRNSNYYRSVNTIYSYPPVSRVVIVSTFFNAPNLFQISWSRQTHAHLRPPVFAIKSASGFRLTIQMFPNYFPVSDVISQVNFQHVFIKQKCVYFSFHSIGNSAPDLR
jgi:hypothetical protein